MRRTSRRRKCKQPGFDESQLTFLSIVRVTEWKGGAGVSGPVLKRCAELCAELREGRSEVPVVFSSSS